MSETTSLTPPLFIEVFIPRLESDEQNIVFTRKSYSRTSQEGIICVNEQCEQHTHNKSDHIRLAKTHHHRQQIVIIDRRCLY